MDTEPHSAWPRAAGRLPSASPLIRAVACVSISPLGACAIFRRVGGKQPVCPSVGGGGGGCSAVRACWLSRRYARVRVCTRARTRAGRRGAGPYGDSTPRVPRSRRAVSGTGRAASHAHWQRARVPTSPVPRQPSARSVPSIFAVPVAMKWCRVAALGSFSLVIFPERFPRARRPSVCLFCREQRAWRQRGARRNQRLAWGEAACSEREGTSLEACVEEGRPVCCAVTRRRGQRGRRTVTVVDMGLDAWAVGTSVSEGVARGTRWQTGCVREGGGAKEEPEVRCKRQHRQAPPAVGGTLGEDRRRPGVRRKHP